MNKWGRLQVIVFTKITDLEQINEMFEPVKKFCDIDNINLKATYINKNVNYIFVDVEIDGCYTSQYCRGCIAEIKKMLREIYKCKIELLLEVS